MHEAECRLQVCLIVNHVPFLNKCCLLRKLKNSLLNDFLMVKVYTNSLNVSSGIDKILDLEKKE